VFAQCVFTCVKLCAGHIQVIDSFVSGAMETLSSRPESIDEIGEADAKHSQLQSQKPEVHPHKHHIHCWMENAPLHENCVSE